MNDILQEFLDSFVVYYLNDILIFLNNEKDHEKHVQMVSQKMRDAGFYVKMENCVFY